MKKSKSTPALNYTLKASSDLHTIAYNGNKSELKKFLTDYNGSLDIRDALGQTPLMYAVLADNRDNVVTLMNAGANLNAKDCRGRTALHWAADNELCRCIKLLKLGGADWKLRDNDGVTILHLSSIHSSPQCLKQVIKYFDTEEVDAKDNDLRTALHWSACCGNVHSVKILLKYNSNIGIPDNKGMTPLHWAAISNASSAIECVRYLLRNRPNVINWPDNDGQTALHLAIANNSSYIIEELISCRYCNVNVRDNMFCTPLQLACLLGLTDVAKLLLYNKAEIRFYDTSEPTPLHYAAVSNCVDTVKLLLSNNVHINSKDRSGRNALAWAIRNFANDVLVTLISHGADLHNLDEHGSTALHVAADFNNRMAMEILLNCDMNVNEVDAYGRSPLFNACYHNWFSSAEYLLKYGAKKYLTDGEAKTALHGAAARGYIEICNLLIFHGVFIDVVDNWGRTPLFYAVFGNHLKCSTYLIENGANLQMKDNEGYSCLHWASREGYLDMVKLLLNYNINLNSFTSYNRSTALDLACLGEHHTVAHFLLKHGALSMLHIETSAATKIQKAFRRYKFRSQFFHSAKTRINRQESNMVYESRRNGIKTCSSECVINQHESSNDSSNFTSDKTDETSELQNVDMPIQNFKLRQENPVKSMHLNRKKMNRRNRSSSMINIPNDDQLNLAINNSSGGNTLSLHLHELQQNKESKLKTADEKSLTRCTSVSQNRLSALDSKRTYYGLFDNFIKSNFNFKSTEEVVNFKHFKENFAVPVVTPELTCAYDWHLNKTFRQTANKEWLTLLGSAIVSENKLNIYGSQQWNTDSKEFRTHIK